MKDGVSEWERGGEKKKREKESEGESLKKE